MSAPLLIAAMMFDGRARRARRPRPWLRLALLAGLVGGRWLVLQAIGGGLTAPRPSVPSARRPFP